MLELIIIQLQLRGKIVNTISMLAALITKFKCGCIQLSSSHERVIRRCKYFFGTVCSLVAATGGKILNPAPLQVAGIER